MIIPPISYLLKRASVVPDDVYDRLQQREGGHTKVTKDQGGVTKGGIAESGGQFTAEQIRNLTPGQIRNAYTPYWQNSGQHFQNPAAAEIAFDMAVNAGPGRTASTIQQTLNQMTPDLPPLPGSSNIGPQTKARMAIVDQSELGRRLYGAFGKHHEQLVAANPKRHGSSAKGWANRRGKLAQAPAVGQILSGKNLPQVFKGIPPKDAVIVPSTPQAPVLVRPNPSPSRSSLLKGASVASWLRRARNATHTDPTPAQAAAGNYAKGELKIHGMAVKLENPKGTTRRGYDKDGGVKWERVMKADYGYFKSTKAADGDAVDCFIGPDPDSELVVVIDQYRGDAFDETKFVLGTASQDAGTKLYLAHYPRGWKLGPVSTTTTSQLKAWLKEGDTKAPFAGQLVKAAVVKQDPETGKWILWTKDGKRKLGTHESAEDAYGQEYAIQKSQERRAPVIKSGYAQWFHENLKRALGQD